MNNLADKYRNPSGDFRMLVARLGANVWHQFREHNCMQQASALAFNTLLCLVPLSAVALFLLKTFGAVEDGNSPLIAALDNFLPRYGAEEIVSELSAFANRNLGGLGVGGFLLFLLVSTMLFMSVERHINDIWGARAAVASDASVPEVRRLLYVANGGTAAYFLLFFNSAALGVCTRVPINAGLLPLFPDVHCDAEY